LVSLHLLGLAGLKVDKGRGSMVALIQPFGSAGNLNIHLHCARRACADGCRRESVPSFGVTGAAAADEVYAPLPDLNKIPHRPTAADELK